MNATSQKIDLAEEVAGFYDDPLGFVLFAFPWGVKGTSLENYEGPRRWQYEFLEWWGDEIKQRGFDGHIPVEVIQASVASGHGIGKAQPRSTIINTPHGVRQWGEISVGDAVFSGDGSPCKVVATHDQGERSCYRVWFDDGSSTVVDGSHVWTVKGRQQRRNGDDWIDLTTEELMSKGVKRSNGKVDCRQWEIPRNGPVQFVRRDVPVAPYVIGAWLGDGGRNSARITSNDVDLIDHIKGLGYSVSLGEKSGTDAKSVYVKEIKGHLKALNVLHRYSYEKSVPEDYKFNDVETRLAVLQGLLDTDGTVNAAGSIIFTSCSERLTEDVIWLARSLGCKASMQPTVKSPWYTNSAGERVEGRPAYNATIAAPDGLELFKIKRKQERLHAVQDRYLKRWIDRIEYEGVEDAMCITVDREDGLYLTNDFIVTHNSALTSWIILFIASTRPDSKGVVTANTSDQLKTKTWGELGKWLKLCQTGHWFDYNASKGNMNLVHKQRPETWRCDAQTCREENSESFAGLHAAGSTPYYIFDEGSAVPDKIFEVSEGGLTDGEPMRFIFGNPTRNTGFFHRTHHRLRHRFKTWAIDSRNVNGTNKQLFGKWEEDWGADSDFFKVRVRGVFPDASSLQFIPGGLVAEAQQRSVQYQEHDPVVIGVDVARFGDDQSVISTRIGRDAKTFEAKKYRGLSTIQLAQRVIERCEEVSQCLKRPVDAVFVDGGGVGGGVCDFLVAQKVNIIEVNFGAKSDEGRYNNKRAECWGRMRDWLKTGAVSDDPELYDDLTGLEYGYTVTNNKIQLERKEDMKKRGLASPDVADALSLTFAYPVATTPVGERHNPKPQFVDAAQYDPYL